MGGTAFGCAVFFGKTKTYTEVTENAEFTEKRSTIVSQDRAWESLGKAAGLKA